MHTDALTQPDRHSRTFSTDCAGRSSGLLAGWRWWWWPCTRNCEKETALPIHIHPSVHANKQHAHSNRNHYLMVMCTFPMVLLSHAIPYPIPDTSHGYKSRAESPQITCKGKTTTTLAQPCQRQNAGSTHRWLSSFTSRLTTKRRKKIPWNSLPCFPQHTTARLLRLRRCLSASSPKKVWETVLIFSSACFFFIVPYLRILTMLKL